MRAGGPAQSGGTGAVMTGLGGCGVPCAFEKAGPQAPRPAQAVPLPTRSTASFGSRFRPTPSVRSHLQTKPAGCPPTQAGRITASAVHGRIPWCLQISVPTPVRSNHPTCAHSPLNFRAALIPADAGRAARFAFLYALYHGVKRFSMHLRARRCKVW